MDGLLLPLRQLYFEDAKSGVSLAGDSGRSNEKAIAEAPEEDIAKEIAQRWREAQP